MQSVIHWLSSLLGLGDADVSRPVEGEASLLFDKYGQPLSPGVARVIAAMLTEVARADGIVTGEETDVFNRELSRYLPVADKDRQGLAVFLDACRSDQEKLKRGVREMAQVLDTDQKTEALALLWAVAMADGTLSTAETRAVDFFATLLGLGADDVAHARVRAKEVAGYE